MTYIDHLLILISACISISAFSFIVGIPKGFMRSAGEFCNRIKNLCNNYRN